MSGAEAVRSPRAKSAHGIELSASNARSIICRETLSRILLTVFVVSAALRGATWMISKHHRSEVSETMAPLNSIILGSAIVGVADRACSPIVMEMSAVTYMVLSAGLFSWCRCEPGGSTVAAVCASFVVDDFTFVVRMGLSLLRAPLISSSRVLLSLFFFILSVAFCSVWLVPLTEYTSPPANRGLKVVCIFHAVMTLFVAAQYLSSHRKVWRELNEMRNGSPEEHAAMEEGPGAITLETAVFVVGMDGSPIDQLTHAEVARMTPRGLWCRIMNALRPNAQGFMLECGGVVMTGFEAGTLAEWLSTVSRDAPWTLTVVIEQRRPPAQLGFTWNEAEDVELEKFHRRREEEEDAAVWQDFYAHEEVNRTWGEGHGQAARQHADRCQL